MLLKKLKILFIEEDNGEVVKFKNAVSENFVDYEITILNKSKEAFSILENSLIDIILLDLNSEKINAIEFISKIKSNPKLKHIPIIILTATNNDNDIEKCYKLGIAGYLIKSLNYQDYKIKINTILQYWSLNEFILK
jgi:response regulator RpfG family c-di-GMP phosphodiesterase